MAPTYKITYFNSKGLTEPIRYILSYAGKEFEDVRFEHSEWPAVKPTTPFGKVPMVEIDGKTVHQSMAICRHLARQYGLVGDGEWDALQADIVVDTLGDMKAGAIEYIRLEAQSDVSDELKKQKRDALVNEALPYYLSRFEDIVKKNNGYFVGGKITWADIVWTSFYESLSGSMGTGILDPYPNLKSISEKVLANPGISAWVAKRPITPR